MLILVHLIGICKGFVFVFLCNTHTFLACRNPVIHMSTFNPRTDEVEVRNYFFSQDAQL